MQNNRFTTLTLFLLAGAVGFLLGRTTCTSNCENGKTFECSTSKMISFGDCEDLNIDLDSLVEASMQKAQEGVTDTIHVINGDTLKTKMIIKRIEF